MKQYWHPNKGSGGKQTIYSLKGLTRLYSEHMMIKVYKH